MFVWRLLGFVECFSADGGICGDSPSRVQENKEVADERGLCVDLPIDGEKGSARPLSP